MRILAVILLIGAFSFTIANALALDRPAFIRIVSIEIRSTPEGRQPGDHYVALSILKDRRADTIGHSSISCTRSFENLSTCEATFVLPRGKIMVQGTRHSKRYFVLAVVGGTGLYSNVGGVLDTRIIAPRKYRLLFSLEP